MFSVFWRIAHVAARCRTAFIIASLSVCVIIFWGPGSSANAEGEGHIGIFISREIKPYMEAFEGVGYVFNQRGRYETTVFPPSLMKNGAHQSLISQLEEKPYDLFIAIGPEAVRFITQDKALETYPLVYTMLLNPGKIIKNKRRNCGISLNMPVEVQLAEIRRNLTYINRLGVLYDMKHNRRFVSRAQKTAADFEMSVIPLQVSNQKEIPAVLDENWNRIDGILFIPDQTVISETIVEYIIKESFIHKKPTIGFNRFFFESGAALAFVFDYREIGKQTARYALDLLSGEPCETLHPEFQTWVNDKVTVLLNAGVSD